MLNQLHFQVKVMENMIEDKFVSDLWQVSGFHQVLRFPPPIKQTAMI
jgi:hypothetical protein